MARLRPLDAAKRQQNPAGAAFSEALARGLAVIGAFDATHRAMSLSDVARAVDLPRATARRALLTLLQLGYVQAEGRQYRLTPRILRLASAYLTGNAVSLVVQPACERIAAAIGLSCTAAVLSDDEAVMIARAVPAQMIPVGAGVGYRLPAYCSALGRVLLAALPDAALRAYLARVTLVAATPHTITERERVHAEILQVRAAGFSYVDQEAEHGFRSIAMPLRKFDGTVIAALNIGARVEAADAAMMFGPYRALLQDAAEDLRHQLV